MSFYDLLIALVVKTPRTKTQSSNPEHTSYTTRRTPSSNVARNRNTVRHTKRSLGSISQIVIISMITLVFGLIYVSEGTKATSFDYELSNVESEITEMNAKKDDLAVEKARLNSVATAKNSTVAAAMEDATVTGYAAD